MEDRATPVSAKRALKLSTTPRRTPTQADRFIPNRSAMDLDLARFNMSRDVTGSCHKENSGAREIASPNAEQYKKQLAENLLREAPSATANSADSAASAGSKILAFKTKPPPPPEGFENPTRVLYSQATAAGPSRKAFRYVPQAPERILDAPDLVDDYYLNLLDWSSGNVVAVALGASVYLWDAETGGIEELLHVGGDSEESGAATGEYVSSVSWAPDGKHLAVGLSCSEVQLWDTARLKQVRTLKGHAARVGALDWNGPTLSSGGRDGVVINHDVRIRDHVTSRLAGHSQEVCGLKWSPSGRQLASGGNDNLLHIWDASSMAAAPSAFSSSSSLSSTSSSSLANGNSPWLHRLDLHQAAVKALAWCPFQANLLASGGGSADRTIKFWNTQTGVCVNSIDTESQVCALQWSKHDKELLSSHGYSRNQLCLWKYPSMAKVAELSGHTARVLHMAQSPDGATVVSAAADETLRFWKAFGGPKDGAAVGAGGAGAIKSKAAAGGSALSTGFSTRSINIR
eukprot:TRINITY_DN5151_c0_g1_i4.p1 TRINITY_DN5151_c0_g1~~TRINITY_DN5151_c0_g1_i4.p1  ORF type:complete len:594 (+),score=14.02 TRINITY_DN5151_c0_g1_i4:237-1784(+)